MAIRVLDNQTIGRIAAGEVVERPASAVKELVENSLDALASAITVEIRDGGTTLIRVTDNGLGIAERDARLAFENHATSKIASGDALTDIATLGFRGEALPSIAAVARVSMTTRARGAEAGVQVTVEGGVFAGLRPIGCPEGTTLIVRDLFFNVPVRRAFLKKSATEAGVIADIIAKLILGNADRAIRLIANGKEVYHSFGDGNIRHAALAVYGRETASKLIEMDQIEGGLHLAGLIGVDDLGRATRAQESVFINGRVVRCPLVTQALEQAARGRLMVGQYPICALALRMPPATVDINVHPNKLEVRFRDEPALRQALDAMFARVFRVEAAMFSPEQVARLGAAQEGPAAQITVQAARPEEGPPVEEQTESSTDRTEVCNKRTEVCIGKTEVGNEPEPTWFDDSAPHKPLIVQSWSGRLDPMILREPGGRTTELVLPGGGEGPKLFADEPEQAEQQAMPDPAFQNQVPYRVIGTYLKTYILLEVREALVAIDQHAAHERILYEQYQRALTQGSAMQQLLTPIIAPFSQRERALLLSNRDLLLEAGYEIEPFGERDIQVRAVPYVLGKAELRPLFGELVDCLDQLKGATIEQRRGEIIQASCKRAVKAGDPLTDPEIQALIEEMSRTGAPPCCPHGRPVMKVFQKSDFEKLFRRI